MTAIKTGYDIDTDELADALERMAEDIRTGDASSLGANMNIDVRAGEDIEYTFEVSFFSERDPDRYQPFKLDSATVYSE